MKHDKLVLCVVSMAAGLVLALVSSWFDYRDGMAAGATLTMVSFAIGALLVNDR